MIGLSVLYDLVSGRSRVRGFSVYRRDERPGAHGFALLMKLLLGAALVGIGVFRRRY